MTTSSNTTTTNPDDDSSSANDFCCIEPHPYGVLPGGNVYFACSNETNASLQTPLPEELWQQVLQYCDGVTLAQVVQVCRDWYVAGHLPELWRDLFLREFAGDDIQEFTNGWKDTYVKKRMGKLAQPHVPMSMPGIYSEIYYRTHLCRSFQIPASWKTIEGGTVERVTLPQSTAEFLVRFEQPNQPVVLAGACKSWKAFTKWNDVDYLHAASSGRAFRATSGAAPLPANFSIQAYHDYCSCDAALLEEAPLYLFDRTALSQPGPLQDDYMNDLHCTCPFWNSNLAKNNGHDLFQYLGEEQRPDHTWLICGPGHSGSAFHIDPNGTHAWNACISGKKRWIFYPPGVTPPGIHPSHDGEEVAMPISIGEWLLNFYPQDHVPNLKEAPLSQRPLECTVEPGDVMFVPHGWWHAVVNLDNEHWNVAITHNYLSQSNLGNVLRFMKLYETQISGCRDRAESIKPEFLKQALQEALVKHGFEKMLNEAQEQAEIGFTCRAWSNDTSSTNENEQEENSDKPLVNKMNRKRPRETNTADTTSIMAKAKQCSSGEQQTGVFSFSFL